MHTVHLEIDPIGMPPPLSSLCIEGQWNLSGVVPNSSEQSPGNPGNGVELTRYKQSVYFKADFIESSFLKWTVGETQKNLSERFRVVPQKSAGLERSARGNFGETYGVYWASLII